MSLHFWSSLCRRILLVSTAVFLLSIVFTACLASGQSVDASAVLSTSQGEASYYADKFTGRTTANGETYDPSAFTAAHRTLPFGSRVRVTRVDRPDEPTVVVRINDRGPYAGERIIDLSEAAARELEMMEEGVIKVRLEVIDVPGEENSPSGD